ncbi:response regulator transcription factor [Cryptosporangium phraense]|uniref:Response regulator transcription factor n=2 Tax=Cryptosporangium phraense TaxID=2593070 RepID=A0A545ATE1_9ACTN|nr:response regulator transcription factor [Cryptosporangium phraense]
MMLGQFDDLAVVGSIGDGADVPPAVNDVRPDVVLMDIRMPLIDGLTATEQVRARPDPPEVIVLTTFDTDRHIRRAMRAGASGFLLKHTPPAEIAEAIRRVAGGEPMLSPDVIRRVMTFAAEPAPDLRRDEARRRLQSLSEGERSVATLVGRGRTNSEIGRELLMSTATVKAYMTRILTKLDLTNRVQVALLVHDAE